MASNPAITSVLMPQVEYTEGGPMPLSEFTPSQLRERAAIREYYKQRKRGATPEQIYDAMLGAADGDYETARSVAGNLRDSDPRAVLVDRMAQGAERPVEALMAAPYEVAKWVEMNTQYKPLSRLAYTIAGGNKNLDAQMAALGLPPTQALAVLATNRYNTEPFEVMEGITSKPSVGNVGAALRGGWKRVKDWLSPQMKGLE